ncbi:hypothetical protein Bca52824_018220 [Brassica carinata]|uniref:Uncharacterized protein n=1 Tax=Brassica carinata TaxID=52824 RepID=A0A8X8AYB7_BRACI|nr:hypothetical protein Bca52824_018220 [Brassica carinata]
MANSYTVLADLRAGRCSNVAEVRFLRFWEAKNINKRGQLMSLEMLLIDEQFISFVWMCYLILGDASDGRYPSSGSRFASHQH